MGIDIYLKWDGMTEDEKQAQYTGFDITAGRVGCLREAYHGEPYATRVFVPEAFDEAGMDLDPAGAGLTVEGRDGWEPERPIITLATLEGRLPATLEAVAMRYAGEGDFVDKAQQSYLDFLALAKEKVLDGRKVTVYASY